MNDLNSFHAASAVVYLSVLVGRVAWLRRVKGINPLTLGTGKRGLPRLMELGFISLGLGFVAHLFLVCLNVPWRLVPASVDPVLLHSHFAQFVGMALIIVSLDLFILSLGAFGDSWRVGIDGRRPGELVTHGVFAVTRNPIFLSLNLFFLGSFLIQGTLLFLVYFLILTAGVHYQIRQEERFLLRTYRKQYVNYCRQTRRYFGWTMPASRTPSRVAAHA